jgi:hypothetical protein
MGTIVAESMVRRAPAEGQPAEALLQETPTWSWLATEVTVDFASLLLGSVSHQVVHHAPCPVTVVRSAASTRRCGRGL